jgi:hypothetical protein
MSNRAKTNRIFRSHTTDRKTKQYTRLQLAFPPPVIVAVCWLDYNTTKVNQRKRKDDSSPSLVTKQVSHLPYCNQSLGQDRLLDTGTKTIYYRYIFKFYKIRNDDLF